LFVWVLTAQIHITGHTALNTIIVNIRILNGLR
jgi:hypothetical protein